MRTVERHTAFAALLLALTSVAAVPATACPSGDEAGLIFVDCRGEAQAALLMVAEAVPVC